MSAALQVVMIAPELDVIGGVVTVVQELLAAPQPGIDLQLHPCVANGDKGVKLRSMVRHQARWLRRLATDPPDVVHVHLGGPVSLVREATYAWQAHALGIPYVAHVHAGHYYSDMLRGDERGRRLFVALLRRAAAVVSVTEGFGEVLRAELPEVTRFEAVPNPMGVEDIEGPVYPEAAESAPVVLYMGWMIEAKGIFDLLEVWPRVRAAVPGVRFVFAGAGADFERWQAEVDRLGHEVEALGWVTGADKWAAMAEADVFVLPSHSEGMPMTVLEAMAMGKPVVATGISGMLEQVVDGETGRLFPRKDLDALAEALIEVCADGALRRRMGEAGRARLEARFERGVVAGRWSGIWKKAAGR